MVHKVVKSQTRLPRRSTHAQERISLEVGLISVLVFSADWASATRGRRENARDAAQDRVPWSQWAPRAKHRDLATQSPLKSTCTRHNNKREEA